MGIEGYKKVPSLKERTTQAPAEQSERAYSRERPSNEHAQVEQIMLRTGAFIVHTINEDPALRHNENSILTGNASFEDDLDMLIATEPSISASSIAVGADEEGRVSGLWSHQGGVLLAGGEVSSAEQSDIGTVPTGIKARPGYGSERIDAETIDAVVQGPRRSLPGDIGGYNELVVNNPEIAGYFKYAEADEQGTLWMNSVQTKEKLQELHDLYTRSPKGEQYALERKAFAQKVEKFKDRMALAAKKGIPFYVMTPDRHFFACHGVLENGVLITGEELKPEQLAKSTNRIPADIRKTIGEKLLEKDIFKDEKTRAEAAAIIEKI